eukprot:CAMPEP_0203757886 /NCGR_PEP_ID=MMETSP0098-20131031/10744_1 /ASSEMBLY_ACC=CAM_ASM_000208 /TAXON_ID=96639 /ORGANISM=" , Strain NY0313808BC1" /LENGTH=542 /DNA_ID=CAMNT_0050650131 /DNA_START=72 /DNA_END=1697 /DNA_ORIENTATION=-
MSLLCGVLGMMDSWSPWLVSEMELYDDVCSRGWGIYRSDYRWGSCVTEGSMSTSDVYCRGVSSGYGDAMCTRTIVAKAFYLTSMLCSVGSIGASLFCHAVETAHDQLLPGLMGSIFAFVAMGCSLGTFFTMATSPLFSTQHFEVMGAGLVRPYEGMGCVFQEPFSYKYWLLHMLRDAPGACLTFGYGYVLTVCGCGFSLFASVILFMFTRDIDRQDETRYSLYGAMLRHLDGYDWLTKRVLSTLVPLIILGDVILTASWMISGTRFALGVNVSLWKRIPIDFIYQVFEFNAVNAVTDFWRGKAYLMSLLTFASTFLVPVSKWIIWLYFWYHPSEQLTRGRVLSWVDALGKIALAIIFTFVLISVAFMFDTTISQKHLFDAKIRVMINTESFTSLWNWILGTLISLIIAHWFVYFHGIATRWEEIRLADRKATLERRDSLFRALNTPPIYNTGEVEEEDDGEETEGQKISLWSDTTYSNCGKTFITVLLVLTVILSIMALFLPSVRFKRTGAVGKALLHPDDYSILSMTNAIQPFPLHLVLVW